MSLPMKLAFIVWFGTVYWEQAVGKVALGAVAQDW